MFNLISRSIAQCSDLVPVGKFLVLTGTNLCSEDNLSQLSPSHPSSTGTAPARPGRGWAWTWWRGRAAITTLDTRLHRSLQLSCNPCTPTGHTNIVLGLEFTPWWEWTLDYGVMVWWGSRCNWVLGVVVSTTHPPPPPAKFTGRSPSGRVPSQFLWSGWRGEVTWRTLFTVRAVWTEILLCWSWLLYQQVVVCCSSTTTSRPLSGL